MFVLHWKVYWKYILKDIIQYVRKRRIWNITKPGIHKLFWYIVLYCFTTFILIIIFYLFILIFVLFWNLFSLHGKSCLDILKLHFVLHWKKSNNLSLERNGGTNKLGWTIPLGSKAQYVVMNKWSVRLVLIMIHWAQQRDRSLAVLNGPRMRVSGAASLSEQQGRGSILWLENLLSLTCQFYCFHEQWRLKKDLEYKQGEKCFITSSIHLSREWKTHPDFKREHELLLSSRSPAFILYLSLPKPCGIRWWALHL